MKNQVGVFNEKELAAVYKILKEYDERTPKNDEDAHFSYYDEYEPIIDGKMLSVLLRKAGNMIQSKEKEDIEKDFLRRRYSFYNNEVDEKAYAVIEKAFETMKSLGVVKERKGDEMERVERLFSLIERLDD